MKKRWEVTSDQEPENSDQLIEVLLKNRGITDANRFFNPPAPRELLTGTKSFFPDLKTDQLNKAVKRIRSAIENKEKIVVWGDYDVDGVCATAVLWQTLYGLGAQVLPHIPDRFGEGYGLNENMIRKLGEEGNRLIITVDSGITAIKEAQAAREIGIDLIITDHHLKPKKLPEAHAIVHTTALCGTGIAWLVASKLISKPSSLDSSLDLVAIATVADLQPLLGANRSLVKEGFKVLNKLDRPGLAALVEVAGLRPGNLGSYAAGWVLGPRINAVGRVRQGIEALRLLCTPNLTQARSLAHILNLANAERQALTLHTFDHAKGLVEDDDDLIVIFHDSWHEGIIGLVAGRVVEEYGRPAIVISKGKEFSKGSARSVNGLNIVEILRAESDLLEDVGGHTAAAGFTIKTAHLKKFVESIRRHTHSLLAGLDPRPVLKIDLPLPIDRIDAKLVAELEKFDPHGIGNPEPVFVDWQAQILGKKKVGRESQHLKLSLYPGYDAIWFRANEVELDRGQTVALAYTPEIERWQGKEKITLRIRDLKEVAS
ncbi:single-stranded-DNA-specific exonuclease RecJ [candidate division WWE3 bacterium RBG_19FT_COMBO_53_11]|uniref:Single-stranded-DNA-specific exonuclease RecJ n=1 Tax=candidate division WWE3 bacterium RBG_19FT_COMBO_53_11 TaxID=1802613 RepID=A0A1F4UIM0_UNCKA|nr:MAG: single-stranded-DNA-specific exonuclease RecJ [candidate division WWE3 bacterium RBG_16_52_45]OGC44818.1 MAG: single-stranded-DNA-specific exonuclease RecJ [candidate division WWE3 bacterium RBG_19FT_COMBO_53_11]